MSTVTIGRTSLYESWKTNVNVNGSSVSINGQESSPPLSKDKFRAVMHNLIAMEERVVPIIFSDKNSLNGFYRIERADVVYTSWNGIEEVADWSIRAERLGDAHAVQHHSLLIPIQRDNAHSITGVTWHAPAHGAYAYEAGSVEPSTITRTTPDGALTIYTGVTESPTWSVTPEDFYKGAATILRLHDGHAYEGLDLPLDIDDWQITNGLLRLHVAGNGSDLTVEYFDGTAWRAGQDVRLEVGGASSAWTAISILRNTPEQVAVRLESSYSSGVGKSVLDLALIRGARTIHGYLQSTGSAQHDVAAQDASATVSNGYLVASTANAHGDKWTLGSADSADSTDTSAGELTFTSTTATDFYFGYLIDAETAGDLAAQYIGTPAAADRFLRR